MVKTSGSAQKKIGANTAPGHVPWLVWLRKDHTRMRASLEVVPHPGNDDQLVTVSYTFPAGEMLLPISYGFYARRAYPGHSIGLEASHAYFTGQLGISVYE